MTETLCILNVKTLVRQNDYTKDWSKLYSLIIFIYLFSYLFSFGMCCRSGLPKKKEVYEQIK